MIQVQSYCQYSVSLNFLVENNIIYTQGQVQITKNLQFRSFYIFYLHDNQTIEYVIDEILNHNNVYTPSF